MKEDLQKLVQLQTLDARIMRLEEELASLPEEYALEQEGARLAENRVAAEEAALQEARKGAQQAESNVREQDDKITKATGQLNAAKTNKEYQLILGQINEAKMELAKAEEAGLFALEGVETSQAGLEAARAALKEREKSLAAAKEKVQGRVDELEVDLGKLREERAGITSSLPAVLVDTYDQIRDRREGIAVVECIDGVCQGCFVNVTTQESVLLNQRDELVRCRTCARILVLPPG